jgi:hypothetical protein
MKRKEANRVCREKKRIGINNKIKQLEETTRMKQEKFSKTPSFLTNNN